MTTLAELRARFDKKIDDEENGNKKGGSNDFVTFNKGSNIVRFLPGKELPLEFFVTTSIHKIPTADGKQTNYYCRRTEGEVCPICDLYFDLWKDHAALNLGRDADGKNIKSKFGNMATSIKAKPRFFAKAVIRELEKAGEYPVKFVAMAQSLFDRVIKAVFNTELQDDDDQDNTTIISLDRGNDFDVVMTDKGTYVSFDDSAPKIKKSKAGNPSQIAEWMEDKLDLNSLLKIGDYEEGVKIAETIRANLDSNSKPQAARTESTEEENDTKFTEALKT